MGRLNKGLMVLAALLNLGFGLIYGLSKTKDTYFYHYGRWNFLCYLPSEKYKKILYRVVIDIVTIFVPIIVLGTLAIIFKNIYL
jgi:hypothetical protein